MISTAVWTDIPPLMFSSTFPNDSPVPVVAFLEILVYTYPGYTDVTAILCCFNSGLKALVNPSIPNLDALYIVLTGTPTNAATDKILTI
jgi:hypothetical protein